MNGMRNKKNIMTLDVETGGLNPYNNGLMSVTLKVYGEDVIKTLYVQKNDRLKYDKRALEINGISESYVNEVGVSEQGAVMIIKQFIQDNYMRKPNILGHNVSFDVQFLNSIFMRVEGRLFTEYVYYHPKDTMVIMDFLKTAGVIEIPRVNLISCYKHFFGQEFNNAHSSEADVIATEKVYEKLLEFINK